MTGMHEYGCVSVFGRALVQLRFYHPAAIGMFIVMAPDVHPLAAAPIGGFALPSDMHHFKVRTIFCTTN